MYIFLTFYILLNFLQNIHCWEKNNPSFHYYDETLNGNTLSIVFVIIFSLSILVSFIINRSNPSKIILVFMIFLLNLILHLTNITKFQFVQNKTINSPDFYLIYYLPIYIANTTFKFEKHELGKALPYAILTTIIITTLMTILNGFLFFVVGMFEWDILKFYIYGVALCPNQTTDKSTYSPKDKEGMDTAQLINLESIGTMAVALTIIEIYLDDIDTSFWLLICSTLFKIGLATVIGYILGFFIVCTIPITNDDPKCCFIIILSSMTCVYYLAIFIRISPAFTVLMMTLPMCKCRKYFSDEANDEIREFFAVTHLAVDLLLYILNVYCAMSIVFSEVHNLRTGLSYWIFGYCCTMLSRLAIYFLLYPIIRRMSTSIDSIVIFANVWASITSNTTFMISFMLYNNPSTHSLGLLLLCQSSCNAIWSNLFNSCSLKFLMSSKYMKKYSPDQMTNITACLKQLQLLRAKYVYMWKMRGFMTDARWDLVEQLTDILKPCKDKISWNEYDSFMGRNVNCPDCGKDIRIPPKSARNLHDLGDTTRKYVQSRLKRTIEQYHQLGTISHDAVKVCNKIIDECITFDKHMHNEIFKSYLSTTIFRKKMYKWYNNLFVPSNYIARIPRKKNRARCYNFVRSSLYTYLVYFFTSYSIILLLVSLFLKNLNSIYFYIVLSLSSLYLIPMCLQVYLFINAYSFIYLKEGFRCYIKSIWHCLEACALLFGLIDTCIIFGLYLSNSAKGWQIYKYVRLIKIFDLVFAFRSFIPKIFRSIEEIIETQAALGYEAAKALYEAYIELEMTSENVDGHNVHDELNFEKWLREDKVMLYEIITQVQYERPRIARAVKTRQILDGTLTALALTLDELRSSGFVDDDEYEIIKRKLRVCDKRGKSMGKTHYDLDTREILFNVAWISIASEFMKDYILTMSTVKVIEADHIIANPGDSINGISVILSGALKLTYQPTEKIIIDILEKGMLPSIKYLDSLNFFEPVNQTLVTGNSFGEMSFITKRQSPYVLQALKKTKILFISDELVEIIEKFNNDPINGIVSQMWKMCCSNLVIAILRTLPKYENCTRHDIMMKVESSFVPDLSAYTNFYFLDVIDELILLDGVIKDYYTNQHFVAPCHIPRSVNKFYLHVSKSNNEENQDKIKSKLIIIPMRNIDKYTVMKLQEEISPDLVLNSEYQHGIKKIMDENRLMKRQQGGVKLAGFVAMTAVAQKNHISKFINLKN